ncbi:MAG: hypothetical protein CM1200mP18_01440 [Gammaproteobacteria bacterium]|nr:MAG: hypothetical protein CM1200mP18_01440 [Gammaproteobacteria bacterium]
MALPFLQSLCDGCSKKDRDRRSNRASSPKQLLDLLPAFKIDLSPTDVTAIHKTVQHEMKTWEFSSVMLIITIRCHTLQLV